MVEGLEFRVPLNPPSGVWLEPLADLDSLARLEHLESLTTDI